MFLSRPNWRKKLHWHTWSSVTILSHSDNIVQSNEALDNFLNKTLFLFIALFLLLCWTCCKRAVRIVIHL